MQTSDSMIELLKGFEGLRLVAYLDLRGIPTIGFGHTNRVTADDVKAGRKCTLEQATAWLHEDLAFAESYVESHVHAFLKQCEFDALVSLVFNIGSEAFRTSTLLRKLNDADKLGAAYEFTVWNKLTINGKKVASDWQTHRRTVELVHFCGYGE